mgnify:CR=1 FL=1
MTTARPLSEAFGDIFVVGGYPQSNYNAMQVNFKRNLSQGLRFNANYTWSHTIDDVVNDPVAKMKVLGFYKLHCWVARENETSDLERQWNPLR